MRGFCLDLDGVVYVGEEPVRGAAGAISWLRESAIPHLFLTNTTSKTRRAISERLARMGIVAPADSILTPAVAASAWLGADPSRSPVALFAPPEVREEFAGLELLDDRAESGAGTVVVGDLGERWDFDAINRAFRLLASNPAARLVALGMTRYWQAKDGLRLDVAPFAHLLAHAADREPIVLGKPAPAFFRAALDRLGLAASEAAMVGDDIRTDVAAAQAVGMRGVLVRTGKFRPEDLEGKVRPDAVLDSIADLRSLSDSGGV